MDSYADMPIDLETFGLVIQGKGYIKTDSYNISVKMTILTISPFFLNGRKWILLMLRTSQTKLSTSPKNRAYCKPDLCVFKNVIARFLGGFRQINHVSVPRIPIYTLLGFSALMLFTKMWHL